MKFVKEFAKRTGDAAVLSETDLGVVALAYELECERNGGDWRLRRTPGQKGVNGKPPAKMTEGQENVDSADIAKEEVDNVTLQDDVSQGLETLELDAGLEKASVESAAEENETSNLATSVSNAADARDDLEPAPVTSNPVEEADNSELPSADVNEVEESESDSEGWITPSNIKRRQAKDNMAAESSKSETKVLQVATMTGDFAMQNVLLQINLNLLSPKTCKRIQNVRTTILRCHGCFATTKDMNKQFCPRCGKPTLTRVSCTTNDKGEVKLHLKQKMQWNNKGNVFSIPKPQSGRANQKWQGPRDGGGKGGWGNGLILAEDQKEYVRAMATEGRTKGKDLMDEDFLPSILRGERHGGGGRVRIGGGRNVNSKKR